MNDEFILSGYGPHIRVISKPGVLQVQRRVFPSGEWTPHREFFEDDCMALHHAVLCALDLRKRMMENERLDDDDDFNLHWHALNFRTASSDHAHACYLELVKCVSRLIKRGWL